MSAGVGSAFQLQTGVGFTVGDQWEPSIAADRYGHVYILTPQYTNPTESTVPDCSTGPSPTMFLVNSNAQTSTLRMVWNFKDSSETYSDSSYRKIKCE